MIPPNLVPLIDGDILRYEVGFGAETGYKALVDDKEAIPPWSFVEEMFTQRVANIQAQCQTTAKPEIFYTEGRTFRFDIAKAKPYKGTRIEKKPWHFKNISIYMRDVLGATECRGIEADDAMAIRHTSDPNTIVCSRDKDLKQVPGWFYSWELGKQPSFGPHLITSEGTLHLLTDKKPAKLIGTGNKFFYAQLLMGDSVDNIPGLPGWGPVATYELLSMDSDKPIFDRVCDAYQDYFGETWKDDMLEQGQLCWICRKEIDGQPEVWQHGLAA